jgi:hypothetical protein
MPDIAGQFYPLEEACLEVEQSAGAAMRTAGERCYCRL